MQTEISWQQLRGSPRTGDVGETLCMAYAPGEANGLSKQVCHKQRQEIEVNNQTIHDNLD